jgi:radical SAM protein with 4Fe4S-binding SPASM domain
MEFADYRMGNVYDTAPDLFGLLSMQKIVRQTLKMAQAIRARRCDVCFAADICDYGCRAFALLETGGAEAIRAEITCTAYKTLRKYLGRNAYNCLLLYARFKKLAVVKAGVDVQITIPRTDNSRGASYKIGYIRDNNINVHSDSVGRIYISFALRRLNLPNYLYVITRRFFKQNQERSWHECYSDH